MRMLVKFSGTLLLLLTPLALAGCVETGPYDGGPTYYGSGYYGGGYYGGGYYERYDRRYYRDGSAHRDDWRRGQRDRRPDRGREISDRNRPTYNQSERGVVRDANGGRWRTESNGQRIWIPGTGR